MNIDTHVNNLITNGDTRFKECDRKWLMEMTEEQLVSMAPPIVDAGAEVTAEVNADADVDAGGAAAAAAAAPAVAVQIAAAAAAPTVVASVAAPAKALTTAEYVAQAPAELQEVLNSGLKMHADRKAALVASLVANERNKFSEDALNAMHISDLENLAALADITPEVNYSIAGGASAEALRSNTEDDFAEPVTELFPVEAAS